MSIAEIVKGKVRGLHQVTTISYGRMTDTYKPKKETAEDLDTIEVVRDVPAIAILLSVDPLDPSTPGYQRAA